MSILLSSSCTLLPYMVPWLSICNIVERPFTDCWLDSYAGNTAWYVQPDLIKLVRTLWLVYGCHFSVQFVNHLSISDGWCDLHSTVLSQSRCYHCTSRSQKNRSHILSSWVLEKKKVNMISAIIFCQGSDLKSGNALVTWMGAAMEEGIITSSLKSNGGFQSRCGCCIIAWTNKTQLWFTLMAILFIVGDMEGHDLLCDQYMIARFAAVKQICKMSNQQQDRIFLPGNNIFSPQTLCHWSTCQCHWWTSLKWYCRTIWMIANDFTDVGCGRIIAYPSQYKSEW